MVAFLVLDFGTMIHGGEQVRVLRVDILTHRYTRICGSEGMFERLGHQSGHTGLWTPVLIPKLPDLLRSGILMDRTVLSPESYCNAGSSSTDPITLC